MDVIFVFVFIFLTLFAILVGTPLFAIIGGISMFLFAFLANVSISSTIVEMCRLANAPGIIAIPLFIFAGYIFAESNASSRLINLSNALLGWMPGGLAVVTLISCAVFTAMTGASGITIVAIGGLLCPALIKDGYDKQFSLGVVTSSGSLGLLFVPSLPIIIYGMVARTEIKQLFIGGSLPGILMLILLGIYAVYYGVKHSIPTIPFSAKKLFKALLEAKWEIPLPFVIIGGIYGGVITVGEAASVAATYALITECLIYREINFKKLITITWDSMIMVGAILVILGTALGFTNFLVDQHVPQEIMGFIKQHISNKYVFLLVLNIFLLIVGCIMDIFSAIVVVVPLIAPVAASYGIDPVHLGIIFLANLELGYLTPPVGMNLFISSLRFNLSVMRLYKIIIPFLLILLLALIIITYWPPLTLFLIELLGQRPPLLVI